MIASSDTTESKAFNAMPHLRPDEKLIGGSASMLYFQRLDSTTFRVRKRKKPVAVT